MNKIILFDPSAPEQYSSPQAAPQPGQSRPSSPPITSAQDFIRMANQAFAKGNLKEARASLRAALAFQPEDHHLILALAHVEFGLGEFETALQRYSVVTEMAPGLAEAYSSRALTLVLMGQKDRIKEAERCAVQALELLPTDTVAMKVLARICLDSGRHGMARHWCRSILNIHSNDAEGLQMLDQCRFDWDELVRQPEIAVPQPVSADQAAAWMQTDGSLSQTHTRL